MKTIYKYPIRLREFYEMAVPGTNPIPLSFQMQSGIPTLWVLVDMDSAIETTLHLRIVGTGVDIFDSISDDYRFIGTVQDGHYVWHLFIQKQEKPSCSE